VELAAPATDGLGRGGLDGDVDTHFFERFGGAILLTLLNIGGSAVADSTDTSIVIASTRAGVDAGSSSLASGANIGPTVTVPQGSPVRVFVSQDLDFSTVGPVKSGASN
ncbi:MAG: TrbI/VirB10 family protein, partial [Hyphomonadaceae bacterium]|nr:TrbI/VirB10 family protein [Hyphomonadaceae bacterium]